MSKTAVHRRRRRPAPAQPDLVRQLVPGAQSHATAGRPSPGHLIEAVRAGLPVAEFDALRELLGVSIERLAGMLGLGKATLHRRRLQGRLQTPESDRLLRYARLLGRATEVMGSLEAGRDWLLAPQAGLGGAVPLDYAATEVGAREVEELLGRIEHGVYS
ncbi:MAG: DUF2384 domain-containing protein [Verrucomicrobia bacterium]|nr:MAG: DUF2384 domain-containing protein [Verrucomicrobiota bacterium]